MKNKFYAIAINGEVLPSTIQYLRRDSIAKFLEDTELSWDYFKKKGYKCVKVCVFPVSKW